MQLRKERAYKEIFINPQKKIFINPKNRQCWVFLVKNPHACQKDDNFFLLIQYDTTTVLVKEINFKGLEGEDCDSMY